MTDDNSAMYTLGFVSLAAGDEGAFTSVDYGKITSTFVAGSTPLDPARCWLPVAPEVAEVTLEDTIARAESGSRVGTELPSDQII